MNPALYENVRFYYHFVSYSYFMYLKLYMYHTTSVKFVTVLFKLSLYKSKNVYFVLFKIGIILFSATQGQFNSCHVYEPAGFGLNEGYFMFHHATPHSRLLEFDGLKFKRLPLLNITQLYFVPFPCLKSEGQRFLNMQRRILSIMHRLKTHPVLGRV